MDCLTAFAAGFVSQLGEILAVPIVKQFGYVVHYKKNINNLKDELEQLKGRKHGVQGIVEADRRNGRHITPNVEDWLCKVDKLENELKGFYTDEVNKSNKCLGGWSPNLVSRHSLSKKARKRIADITRLKSEKLEIISYPMPPPRIGSTFSDGIRSFASRKSIMTEVIESLKDDKFKRIGICGMGGVGKTTFVKEVIKIVEDDKLFDEVVMAVVSQNANYMKIQGQIADALGLKFDKESEQGRAHQLLHRLKNIESVLIVLDDVWTELDFESIGLPSSDHWMGCKILFTSRNEEACYKMRSQKNFTISTLSQDEAWDFFQESAGGNLVDKHDIHQIAKQVANECGGLPIAIVTIAKALATKEKHTWEDALDQLRKSSPTSLSEMQDCVYSCIKLSYNFLGSEEGKYLLMLCSLFPEDSDIPIEVLLRHSVGFGLFKGIDELWKVRNRVHALVDKLKRHFMLLDSYEEECVKMHDVVRDVVISIASEEHRLMARCDANPIEWTGEETWRHASAISLMFDEMKVHLNGLDLEYPKLKLLQVASKKREQIAENFFHGMSKLMVLGLQSMCIQSKPSVFGALDSLHTLRLEDCQVGDISTIGEKLRKLEILSFSNSNIKQLPVEIGQLKLLRLLDLTECNYLDQISPNVLASLSRLEELYLRVRNFRWEENKSILVELESLSRQLKVFEISTVGVEALPKDLVFKNIVRFWVYVGDSSSHFHGLVRKGYLYPNILKVNNAYYNYVKRSVAIQQLLKKVEILKLVDVKHLKNVIYELDEGGFPYLKILSIEFCNNLEYVVDASDGTPSCAFPQAQSMLLHSLENLKEICHVPNHMGQVVHFAKYFTPCQCFGSLTELKIEFCSKLKTVFSLFPWTSLEKLQRLHVYECHGIECIISSTMEVEFSNLQELKLQELPCLFGFTEASVTDEPHLPKAQQLRSSQLVEAKEVGDGQLLPGNNSESVIDEHSVTVIKLFKSNWLQRFPKLEKIFLRECSLLEMVFDMQESQLTGQQGAVLFGQLQEIEISWLTQLIHVWGNVPHYVQGFQNLRSLKVRKCDSLRYVFTPTIARALTQLQNMVIQSCQLVETLVGSGIGQYDDAVKENVETLAFGKLDSLTLQDLPSLVSICPDSYELVWPYLRYLCIDGCPRLKTPATPIQTLSEEDNLSAFSNSSIHDVDVRTSKENSSRFLQRCLGCIPHASFSNSMAKAKSEKDHTRSVNEMQNKAKIGSCMPILEQLQVKGWDSLDVIFQIEQNQQSGAVLNCLIKLMHVSTRPVGVPGFSNLTLLSLDACHRLRHLFSYSIAKLLVKLQEIKISNCKMLERVVKVEGDHRIISSPQPNSIEVIHNWSQETCALEWPSLKRISFINCSMLEFVIGEGVEDRTDVASFAQLQSLTLSYLPNLVSFCHRPCVPEQPSLDKCQANRQDKQDRSDCNEDWRELRHSPLIDGFLFPNLTYLAITGCNKINCLFSPSSSTSLLHLQELEICGCENIEEIVSNEETQASVTKIVFFSLQRLKLERLSNLRAFCQGSYDFDFPSLHEVLLGNCHKMEIFSYGSSYTPKLESVALEIEHISKNIWMGDLNATAQLSKGILAFQTSETLRWIKEDKGILSYFIKETEVIVDGFQRLLNLVPSNVKHMFKNLKQLTVKNCSSLIEVFESEEMDIKKVHDMIHYELEVMHLYSLPKLIHIWENLGGVMGFQKLRILKVENCDSLKNMISPSIATSLLQLQHLRVCGCHMMEEILITKEDEEAEVVNKPKIFFPLLNKLELRHLPNLKCFCPSTLDFELPSCEEMIIEKCLKMKTFSYGAVSTPKLSNIYKGSYGYVEVMGDLNMAIYHIHSEDLKVALQTLETIRCIEQDHRLFGYLTRVTELVVEGCEKLLNCVPSNMLHRFQHLKQLKVRECGSLVEIFESRGVVANEDEGDATTPYYYNMQEINLYSLPKLVHIWKNHGGVLGFQNLKMLNIGRCDGLKSVLSPSMARSLLQLQELSVYECEMIEEIVMQEDEKMSKEPNKAQIIFPSLLWLTLYRLPSLECFCSSNYNFELPSCRDITIKECSKMEACGCGTMSTPELFFSSLKKENVVAKGRL